MSRTLRAIQNHPRLRLQLIVTGMHLDRAAGRTINQIRIDGWKVDATIGWKPAGSDAYLLAEQTATATAGLARTFKRLKPDIVLVTGDRIEAFAAAAAAHLSQVPLAHVHGGDRALGQVDDTLRHAISKLAHIHFPATAESAQRIEKLGEDKWRIHQVGSPGLDGLHADAMSWADHQKITLAQSRRRYALVVLHPADSDETLEFRHASMLLKTCQSIGFDQIICIGPNNDPGSTGIIRAAGKSGVIFHPNLVRGAYLGMLRDAAVLLGNSSSGIIEAASFGTPVIDVGPRQQGRLRGENVTTVPMRQSAIRAALAKIWNNGLPLRYPRQNIYGRGDTAKRICRVLSSVHLDQQLLRKLIAY